MTLSKRAALVVALMSTGACGGVRGATEVELAEGRNVASTGALIYERSCESCHGERGEGTPGGPAILGKRRYARSDYKNAQDLFDYVAKTMPKDNPSSLDITQYWHVVTFVVATTGVQIPGDRLSESNASEVRF